MPGGSGSYWKAVVGATCCQPSQSLGRILVPDARSAQTSEGLGCANSRCRTAHDKHKGTTFSVQLCLGICLKLISGFMVAATDAELERFSADR